MRIGFFGEKTGVLLTVAAMTLFSATACQVNRQPTAMDPDFGKAHLDLTTGEISLPLDPYVFSSNNSQEVELYQKARDRALEACMTDRGFSYYQYQGFVPQLKHTTRYGVWNLEHARIHGFDESPITDDERQKIEADAIEYEKNNNAEHGQDYYDALDECSSTAESSVKDIVSAEDSEALQQKRNLLIRLAEQARKEAVKDPEWQKNVEEWKKCIKKENLTPRTADGSEESNIYGNLDIMSEEAKKALGYGIAKNSDEDQQNPPAPEDGNEEPAGPNKQEEIRIAVIEAQCNVNTGLARKLADIEASKQKKLIEENEAIVREEQEIRQRVIKSLQQFLK